MSPANGLPQPLVDEVLERLELPNRPAPGPDGLAQLYAAWCRHVPFDNVRKRIHIAAGDPSPLPGTDPAEFLRAWLQHGTGGTCFPTAGGLAALLEALGFRVNRIVGAMLTTPDDPIREDHGTLVVRGPADDEPGYLLDTALLHSRPLPLRRDRPATIDDPLHPLTVSPQDDLWRIDWQRPHDARPMICRMLRGGLDQAAMARLYERTRTESGFNAFLYARVSTAAGISVLLGRKEYRVGRDGRASAHPLTDRRRRMVELGFSDEIAARLPPDEPFN